MNKSEVGKNLAVGGASTTGAGVGVLAESTAVVGTLTKLGVATTVAETVTTATGVALIGSGAVVGGLGLGLLYGAYKVAKKLAY